MFSSSSSAPARQHTTRPIVTGTSVLGIVYDGGVLLAADTLLSYGSMAKAQNVPRLQIIGATGGSAGKQQQQQAQTVLGASGEYSDFQKIVQILQQQALQDSTTSLMDSLYEHEHDTATAEQTWNYLRMLLYSRRNKMNPFWNDLVVAGTDLQGQPFLGLVDKIGTTVRDNFIATGFGSYLAMPLLREQWRPDLTEGEARALLEDCMKVLFYRDCRASPRIQLAKCGGGEPAIVSDPYDLETSWDAASFQAPKADLEGDGGW